MTIETYIREFGEYQGARSAAIVWDFGVYSILKQIFIKKIKYAHKKIKNNSITKNLCVKL